MPAMPAAARAGRGFTLVELMAALAVMAVVVLLAVPSFGEALARHRLQAAGEELAFDLAEAQQEVTRTGGVLHLSFAVGPQWCYALARQPGCDCQTSSPCQLKVVDGRDHPGVQLLRTEDARIDARPGHSRGGSALLQVREGTALRVTLSPLGRPQICAAAGQVRGYPGC